MSSGNPAGRLLGIVEEAREIGDNTSIKKAWESILEVDRGGTSQLMFRMGRVMLLPEQAMAEIREHYPEEEEDQEYWVGQVNMAFSQGIFSSQKWNGVKTHLDDHTVRYLKMATAMLRRVRGEQLISSDKLDAMRSKLNEVLGELEATNLSAKARVIIRRHLNAILGALDEYKICGKQGIEEASHRAVGELAVDKELREEVAKTSVGKNFVNALFFVFAGIGAASSSLQLASDVPEFLEDMRASEEQVVEKTEDADMVSERDR